MKKFTLTILLSYCIFWNISSQNVILSQFPQNYQLIPRNTATNKGTYRISGTINSNLIADTLRLDVYRESSNVYSIDVPIQFKNGTYSFALNIEIKAELANYRIELSILNKGTVVFSKKAEKVVSGDVIVINGQSNCIGSTEPIDFDPFMRCFTYQFGWNDIRWSQAGKWSSRLARNIVDNQKIPVAVFNEAYGGERLEYFLKNTTKDSSNYKSLYNRLKAAEIHTNIRAICWWQGESDGWETPIDTYRQQFKRLYDDWQQDYNRVPVFYFQVRFKSCHHIKEGIMEVQRDINKDLSNAEVMSTSAAMQLDSCHFYYNNGYDSLGNRMYRLIAAKLYGTSATNTLAPDIEKAWFSNPIEITVQMKNFSGDLRQIGKPWNDFELNGTTIPITQGRVQGDKIILSFSADTAQTQKITGVTYKSHITKNEDWIVNPLGVGILTFYNFPLSSSTSISENQSINLALKIYPTFASDNIYFSFTKPLKSKTYIQIISITGEVLLKYSIEMGVQNGAINIQHLPKGVYFARHTEGGATSKFIKG